MIDISGLNKAAVLAALYNRSRPQGNGFLVHDPSAMTVGQAQALLNQRTDFDYIQGRVMKVRLHGDSFDEWLYDRDNGQGAAARAVESVRQAQEAMGD